MRDRNPVLFIAVSVLLLFAAIVGYSVYRQFRVDVPSMHIAVITRQTGKDLENDEEVATSKDHKGLQLDVLTEGRHFMNPYTYNWKVYPMVDIPSDKMGVRVRLYGQDLPYGHFVATKEEQRGIVSEVLKPGRYAINGLVTGREAERPIDDYVEIIELHEPVTIPAGFRGVVTNLAGPIPENPNTILVDEGHRGVQKRTLDAGTYYLNPYMWKIDMVDCRSQRFNLATEEDLGFPSKDGFWISLDGIIEFRIDPEKAAEVFVLFNEANNDKEIECNIAQEVVKKVILPNARSFCRLRGSNNSGREFIGGQTRTAFQKEFQDAMHAECDSHGVEIVQALITKINPPQAIAKPVRDREVARQQALQYIEETKQQEAEANLATENALITQGEGLVGADQEVVKVTTKAMEDQEVKVTKANQDLEVAKKQLDAAKDRASAILAEKKAEAAIIELTNKAEAAGWKQAIQSLGGDGNAYARYVLLQKLAPAYQSIMANTADSPLMDIFRSFGDKPQADKP